MLNSYEESGKEFGLTHKGSYLLAFLFFRVLCPIVAYFSVYFLCKLVLDIGDQVLTYLDYLGIQRYSSTNPDIVDNFYLFIYLFWASFITFIPRCA